MATRAEASSTSHQKKTLRSWRNFRRIISLTGCLPVFEGSESDSLAEGMNCITDKVEAGSADFKTSHIFLLSSASAKKANDVNQGFRVGVR